MPTSDRAAAALAVMLAGCSPAADPTSGGSRQDAAGDPTIVCGRGDGPLASRCTVERRTTDRELELIVRAPDGGFRRLLVVGDGRGVIAADGAEPAQVRVIGGDRIAVRVGADRYELPATIGATR